MLPIFMKYCIVDAIMCILSEFFSIRQFLMDSDFNI